jgi:TonB family protein
MLGVYCFDTGKTDLRYSYILAAPTLAVGRGVMHITSFQGKTIPSDLEIRKGATLVMTAHLETIEALPQLDDALFVPPADAKLYPTKMASPEMLAMIAQVPHDLKTASNAGIAPNVPKANGGQPMRVTLLPGFAETLLLQKTPPVHPSVAKAARVSGTVVLQAVISTSGEITDLQVVSGPTLLQGAAVDAVKTWRYRPFLLNGTPTTVQTTINVVFTLGG